MNMQLHIRHNGEQNGKPQFVVLRQSDGKTTQAVSLIPPEQTVVPGRPDSNLQQDLRWYLDDFINMPLGGYLHTAERVQKALKAWGQACFEALFQKDARDWYQDARRNGLDQLRLKIASNEPSILAWPWEALHDPETGTLAHHCRIERQLGELHDPLALPDNLPKDRINLLLVIARPYGDRDVGFHALSRPLVELMREQKLPLRIDVLRPPTFEELRQTLHENPSFYHIVHFDGHGGYGESSHPVSAHAFKGPQGKLIFENEQTEPNPVTADKLGQLLAEYRIPIMVLNACQSAQIDARAENAFASVAASLLKAGIRSVVAMGYSLYVSGAQQFVPAFYRRLFESANVAEATRAGRQAMLASELRVCPFGEHPLQDWLVPVLYQQMPLEEKVLPQLTPLDSKVLFQQESARKIIFPKEAHELGDYGFIGRERAVQALERAFRQPPQAAILIHGMAGVGKTTLAKGYLNWLLDTDGLGAGTYWYSFNEIRSAEFMINDLIDKLLGTNARAAPIPQKVAALVQILREQAYLLVWDNFESASGIAGTEVTALLPEEDRNLLKNLLKQLRGGKTRILITSRSPESWLTVQECYRLPLGGLQGEECWEYCNAVVRDLGLNLKRDDPQKEDFLALINELDGHPLALRAILLRLAEQQDPAKLLADLKQQFKGAQGDESTRRILAVLALFEQGFPVEFDPILQLIGLHERHVQLACLEAMLETAGDNEALAYLSDCLSRLEQAGLLQQLGQGIYLMHPALRSHLSLRHSSVEARQSTFADFFAHLGDYLALKDLHEQRTPFAVHGGNFHHALELAKALNMEQPVAALTQNLAFYAQNTRDYAGARRLFEKLANDSKRVNKAEWEAVAYHQLGRIDEEQRDFEAAEGWYKQSLAIEEKRGNEQGAAKTYHQLGSIAQEQRDFEAAERWYKQSLAIKEKYGNEQGSAKTYHQLGSIAQEQRDFEAAERWYK
ncbi:MAG: CHAT domain-containing protein, partial [Methylococcales bacterium]